MSGSAHSDRPGAVETVRHGRHGRRRIAINAQLAPDGRSGGIEQAVRGLVQALGRLEDDTIDYVIITSPSAPSWLDAVVGVNQTVVVHAPARSGATSRAACLAKRVLAPARPIWRRGKRLARALAHRSPGGPAPPSSDGFIEALGVDVIHFPYQTAVLTTVPSIFNPWDLQHLHHPEFFSPTVLASREAAYPVHCRRAAAVVAGSRWTRRDVIEQYDITPERVYVIPLAASTSATVSDDEIGRVRAAYRLPDAFALYPAQTWPHKNHLRLLEALALVRDRHRLRIRLVCTGARNGFWPTIEKRIAALGLRKDALFLGFVPDSDLAALYRLASFVVIPSLFEGWGFPVIEAFQAGAPLASSDATALREYAGGAALLFDPTSVESIAEAIARMATDGALRDTLSRQGRDRATRFSWERAARTHRALYRRVLGGALSEEDEWLLQASA